MPAFLKKRDNILVLAFGLVLVFFIGRMLQMQLIQGDEYESQIYKGTIKTQTVEAARGEITDRYGNPIVTNRVSMNIVLDKAFLPAETQNEIILSLMQLLEQNHRKLYMIGNNRMASVMSEDGGNGDNALFESAVMFDEEGDIDIPGGTYLSVCYHGVTDSRRQADIIRAYAAEHRIVLKPPFMDLMWIDVHISADPAEYISEVQVRAEWKQEK